MLFLKIQSVLNDTCLPAFRSVDKFQHRPNSEQLEIQSHHYYVYCCHAYLYAVLPHASLYAVLPHASLYAVLPHTSLLSVATHASLRSVATCVSTKCWHTPYVYIYMLFPRAHWNTARISRPSLLRSKLHETAGTR